MIIYETDKDFRRSMEAGHVKVADYALNRSGALVMTLVNADTNKKLRVSATDFTLLNEEFEILGQTVKALELRGYHKFYSGSFFSLAAMTIENQSDKRQLTITGGLA